MKDINKNTLLFVYFSETSDFGLSLRFIKESEADAVHLIDFHVHIFLLCTKKPARPYSINFFFFVVVQ